LAGGSTQGLKAMDMMLSLSLELSSEGVSSFVLSSDERLSITSLSLSLSLSLGGGGGGGGISSFVPVPVPVPAPGVAVPKNEEIEAVPLGFPARAAAFLGGIFALLLLLLRADTTVSETASFGGGGGGGGGGISSFVPVPVPAPGVAVPNNEEIEAVPLGFPARAAAFLGGIFALLLLLLRADTTVSETASFGGGGGGGGGGISSFVPVPVPAPGVAVPNNEEIEAVPLGFPARAAAFLGGIFALLLCSDFPCARKKTSLSMKS
jgi:hypothetical protein